MTTPLRTITLYKTKGTEDKVYGLAIVPVGELFDCTYFNGRRGGTMQHGKKTSTPGSLEKATAEYEKTMKTKMKDGYTPAESGEAFTNSENAGRISGYLPMLPADLPKASPEAQLREMLDSDEWAAQEKMDGENRIVIIKDGQVAGTNKNGLLVNLPFSWSAFAALGNVVLCGEHIGDDLHVFDIHDTSRTFEERYAKLRFQMPKWQVAAAVDMAGGVLSWRSHIQQQHAVTRDYGPQLGRALAFVACQ